MVSLIFKTNVFWLDLLRPIMNNSTALGTMELRVDLVITTIVINCVCSILTCVLNFLVILCFIKTSTIRTPSNILILCLAITDFAVGALVQPAFCATLLSPLIHSTSLVTVERFYIISSNGIIAISFLIITVITIDRFLAIHLHLRYQEIVTTKRLLMVIALVIVICLSVTIRSGHDVAYNKVHVSSVLIDISLLIAVLLLNAVLMMKIACVVRKHSARIHSQQQSHPTNLTTYKKSVNTMYYIMGILLICYIPEICFITKNLLKNRKVVPIPAFLLTHTLMLVNSVLNPIVYWWRIQEMRNIAVQLIRSIRCQHGQP